MGYRCRVYKRTKLKNGNVKVESVDGGTYAIYTICKVCFWYPIKYMCLLMYWSIYWMFMLMYWSIALPIKWIIGLINKNKENNNEE